ncbi:cytochrome B561 [Caballeronia catudaia]|uniref:Cytochrome B561 n=1 Tax=Caballeronia catudaia TaxID=1777136 RepID=A0A157ZM69_9BURK|nr:cytochrome b/b6 domain-containing protein [Caballeronia catudaia]SAK46610.1 cytochrome B561 [Caballeronia catudaia]
MRNLSASVYNAPARVFHWLTAALLLLQYLLAWTMPDVHRDTKPIGLIAWHLGVGMVIILLVVLRLLWRSTHDVPPEPGTVPPVLRIVARFTHWLLYILLLAVPLMGWANASSRGWPVTLFAFMPMPPLSPAGSSIGHALGDWHRNIAWVLLALVALHVGAALFHRFVLRDGTLERMFPARRNPASSKR